MATFPPLRPGEQSAEAEGSAALRDASPVRTGAAAAVAAAAFLAVVLIVGGGVDRGAPRFLDDALGPAAEDAPLVRRPAPGIDIRIDGDGYTVARGGSTLSVSAEDVGGADWRRHVHGVSRPTEFGTETIVVDGNNTEEFLTVSKRQGDRTWRWRLDTGLTPRLGPDGAVSFLDGMRVTDLVVSPVAILDEDHRNVTPAGLRWGLAREHGVWWLTLRLDDSELPLPYVIDPGITFRAAAGSNNGGGGTSLALTVPGGIVQYDVMLAQVTARGGTGTTITAPACGCWTLVRRDDSTTNLAQAIYVHGADASEPGSYTWTITSNKAAGGIVAYAAVENATPVNVHGGQANASSATVTAPSVTTTVANTELVGFFGSARGNGGTTNWTSPGGMSERWDESATGGSAASRASAEAADELRAAVGATGSRAATNVGAAVNIGQLVALAPDTTLPNTSITSSPANPSNSASPSFSFTSTETGSTFECRLDGAAWAACTSPKSYSGLTDGSHTFDVRATDPAGNVDASPASFTWTIDTAAPNTSITSSPADPSNSSSPSFSFSSTEGGSTFECRLDGAAWASCTSPKSYAGLADGSHTFAVRATDPAGNVDATAASVTWTIDTVVPDTTITSSPADPSNSASSSFSFSSSEGGSSFDCRLDGGAWSACTSPKSYASLADGSHTFAVRATDTAGNTDSSPAGFSWTVDTLAPQTTIDNAPADPSSSTNPSFDFSANQGGSTFECRLDGAAWAACTSPKSYSGLTDGSHTFDVRATDTAGNTDASPASFTWMIDTGPPDTSISGGPSDPTNATGASFSFGATEGGSTFDCRLDGGAWSACTSPKSYAGLADGAHTFAVRATDGVGNTDPSPASATWTVDTVAPNTSITSSPTNPTNSTGASFDFSATEGGSSFECRLDGGAWSACTGPKSYAGLADGSHTFAVRATDPAGNVDATPASFSWTVDTVAPNTSITSSPADPTNSTGASFDFSATEGGATFECSLDGGAWSACTSPKNNAGFADGSHTFAVRGTDTAGNTDATPAGVGWTVDTVAPNTSITSSPTDPTNATGASFDFSATEGGSTFECRLDGGAWSACTSPESYAGLADGSHTFDVRATDPAGNTDPSAAGFTWTVDTAAPQTTIDSNPADPTNAIGASFTFSSSESGSTFACEVDGGGFSACTSPKSYAGLTESSHTFRVRATDPAGNTDPSAASFTWLVDTTTPSGSLTVPVDGAAVRGASVAVSSDSADAGSGVASADFQRRPSSGGPWTSIGTDGTAPYSVSWDTTALADGDYDLRVVTTDAAGNAFTSGTRTVTVDNTPPSSAALDGLPAAIRNGQVLTGSGADLGSGVASLTYLSCPGTSCTPSDVIGSSGTGPSYSVTWASQPADGEYQVLARVTDLAGNTRDSAPRTVMIDNTNPTGSLTAPGDGAFVSGSVAVSSDSADAGSGVGSVDFERRPAGGGAWAAIGTDASAPYSVSWSTGALADGDYDLRAVTTDLAGNALASPTRAVTVDNTAPGAPVLTLAESSPYAFVAGSEIFVNTPQGGSYDVGATAADAGSGITRVSFPGGIDDTTVPYGAAYAFADLSSSQTVTAYDGAGNSTSASFVVTSDTAAPAGGSASYADGYDADGQITVATADGSDSGAGVDSATGVLERRTSGLADDGCAPFFGAWSGVTSPDTVGADLCAQYRYRVSDRVGNEAVYGSGNVVKVDLTAPAAPWLTVAESEADEHVSGSTLYYNPGGGASGAFTVDALTADAQSGIDRVTFPAVFGADGGDDSVSPYSHAYSWTSSDSASGAKTVIARNGAGLTASTDFTVQPDTAAPSTGDDTAAIGSAWSATPVTVTLSPSDTGAGVAATYYTTDGTLPTTSSAEGTSVVLSADGVYTVRYFSVDHVGNAEPVQTASTQIRVDRTDPSAPAVDLAESSPYAHVSGSEIFLNTGQSGAYDVSATAADAGSGVQKVRFPGAVDDFTSPYGQSYSFVDLSGSQTVSAHDNAGNSASSSFTVTPDTVAPAGGSVTYPDGYDSDGQIVVSVDGGSDALSGLAASSAVLERRTSVLSAGACDPFVGAWTSVTSPDTVPTDTCAQYRYRVSDRVGNEAVYASANVVMVDLTAPQTTIDAAPSDPTSGTAPSFQFSANESGSTFECELDGASFSACGSPKSYAGLADGGHTFRVRATDSAGNTDPSPAVVTWTIDTGAPNTTIDSAPSDPSNDAGPSFQLSADESATFECRLDGGAWSACTSPETYAGLADGSHTFRVRATDGAGNVDPTPASFTWTVDTAAPDTAFTVVPSDPSADPSPSFQFSATEGGSSFQCRLDGASFTACSSPQPIGPLPDGSHTLTVRATDSAGNTDATPASYTWRVDATAPSITISEPAGAVNAASADPFTVRATSPDGDVATVELFRCSDASTECSAGTWISLGTDATAPYEASWPVDADGNRTFRALAMDAGGNVGETAKDITIDRTRPATTIDSAPPDPDATPAATFVFSGSEAGVSFECELDGSGFSPCSSPASYSGLADGSHTFRVRATDPAGNLELAPRVHTWAVDTAAPETAIDSAPADPSPSQAPSFAFSASEPSPAFECRFDGGAWSACTSPESYAGLADGSHTFRVRATDAAGNVDASPAVYTWTIDATPPGGGLADPGANLRGSVTLSASPSDTGAGVRDVDFQVSPANGGTWTSVALDANAPYTAAWDTTALADGLYDLRVVVTDNAGNASPSAELEDRRVDNTAPVATMSDPGAFLSGTVLLSSSPSDSGSGVASVGYERSVAGAAAWVAVPASWDTTGSPDGLYDVRVVVTDGAGNVTAAAPVTDRRLDNTKPSLTFSAPADGSTVAAAGSLQLTASEDTAGIANAMLDGAPAPAQMVSGSSISFGGPFADGPHTLAGELEDLAGNRRVIRVHFTVWSLAAADYPYVEKNVFAGVTTAVRAASDAATVTMPDGAALGAPAGDWLVLRVDPQPAGAIGNGFEPATDAFDVTAYWALSGVAVHDFAAPIEIAVDNSTASVVPATLVDGAWRSIAPVPSGRTLPASWADGFYRDGSNVVVLSRHLSFFTLLRDAKAPSAPGAFKGTVSAGTFSLSWNAATDNSGLVAGYRVYANGALVRSLSGTARSVSMGAFRRSDGRSFQVAAVDAVGNVGAKSKALRIVPKLTRVALAQAKSALKKRGFKTGRIVYRHSSSVPAGSVLAAGSSGILAVGAKVALTVSSGAGASPRSNASTTPPSPPGSSGTGPGGYVYGPTSFVPSGSVVDPSGSTGEDLGGSGNGEKQVGQQPPLIRPELQANEGISGLRRLAGLGLLALAFGTAGVSAARLRRRFGPPAPAAADEVEALLLWDTKLLRLATSTARRLAGRG